MAYRGQIAEIPLGLGGLTGDQAKEDPSVLVTAENFEYRNNRIVRSFGLIEEVDSPYDGIGPILGISGTTSPYDSTVYVIRGFNHYGPWGTYEAGFRSEVDRPVDFTFAGREGATADPKLFVFSFNGLPLVSEAGRAPQTIDLAIDDYNLGKDEEEQVTLPNEWRTQPPIAGTVSANRLWVIAGHRVYYSSPTNHLDFTSSRAGSISVFPGEGDRLSAITSFRGLVVLWKFPRGLYTINPQSLNVAEWSTRRISDKLGAIGSQAVHGVDQDVLFFDTGGGLHSLGSTDEYGDVSSSDITQVSEIDEWISQNVDFDRIDEVRMAYDEREKELHILMPSTPLGKNVRVILSFVPAPRFRIMTTGDPTSIAIWRETDTRQFTIMGMRDGKVYRVDHTLNVGNSQISEDNILREPMKIKTAPLDFGYINPQLKVLRKTIDRVRIDLISQGGFDLTLSIDIDHGAQTKRKEFTREGGDRLSSTSGEDSFTLGQTSLATDNPLDQAGRIKAIGHSFAMTLEENFTAAGREIPEALGNFAITGFFLFFKAKELDPSDG